MRVLILSSLIFTLAACDKATPTKAGSTAAQTIAVPYVGEDFDAGTSVDAASAVDASVAAPPPPRPRLEGCPEDVVDCCPYAAVEECTRIPGCRNSYAVVFDERSKCWPTNAVIYGCVGLPTEETQTPPPAKSTGKDESGNCLMVKRELLPFGVEPGPCGEGAPTCP